MTRDYLKDLEIMFDHAKHLKRSMSYEIGYTDDYGNRKSSYDHRFFSYVMSYFERDKFPKVVDDKTYKNINVPELYHGFSEYEYGANMLADWQVHYGIGYQSHGFHMTSDKKYAFRYTKNDNIFESKSYGRIMRCKPMFEKTIGYRDLTEMRNFLYYITGGMGFEYRDESIMQYFKKKKWHIKNVFSKIPQTQAIIEFANKNLSDRSAQSFVLDIIDNPGVVAIFYGYDAINPSDDITIALDHSKVIVPENDAVRFLKKSKSYRDGVLNRAELDAGYVLE